MSNVGDLLKDMQRNLANVRFSNLCQVCDEYFGQPRQKGTSHRIYKTPWRGDPRVNIQNFKGKAKPYQVRQELKAINRLKEESNA